MRISIVLLLSTALAAAQPAAPAKPEDLGSISGQALNAVTGEPVRRATILLTRSNPAPGESGPPPTFTTATDAGGLFTLKDLEPGTYRLSASRNGFVPFAYGARGPLRPGALLTLSRRQNMTGLTLKLTPHGVLTGRIVDEEGEPVANVRIMLQSYRYLNGRRQLTGAGGGGSTNDLGEYRVFGVAPGKYYLSATAMATSPYALDRSASPEPEEDYVATYYPGTIDPAAAAQIEVAAGAQLRGLDMRLSKARTVRVKGKFAHGSSGGRQNTQVMLVPRNPGGIAGMIRATPVDAAGNFEIRHVTPGAYTLVATVNEAGNVRQSRMPVDVGSSNVEGLNLSVAAGLTLKARARSDPDGPPVDLATVRFMLQPREPDAVRMGGGTGKVEPDGSFELKNLFADHYNLMWFGLPPGAYVKSARAGQIDVLASGLDLTSGAPPEPLDIVLSPRAAIVTGAVQDSKTGNAAPGATVVLIPQEKERREQQAYYRSVVADQHGAFSIPGVAPGEYQLYAWEDLEPGAYMDPDVVKAAEGKGESLTLREGDQKSVPLKLIPADAGAN